MPKGKHASKEEIEAALYVLAETGDNARQAAMRLDMPHVTLCQWRNKHAELYADIRNRKVREIEESLVHDFRENAVLSQQLQRVATLAAYEQVLKGDIRDPAKVAQQAAVAAGIATDKLLTLTDRPTQIVEHRDPQAALSSLAQKLGITVDSTAEDMGPAPSLEQGTDSEQTKQ